LKLKGSKINAQTQQVQVTQIAEIEGPVGVDDIRKYLMPMPFNAPSPVLFQLLGWLTDASKGVVSTASEKIAEATSNTPVGTTQALIEQGAIIFSSIHARLHHSQTKAFEIVLRILRQYLPQKLAEYQLDPQIVNLKNIQPVSDPHVFSEAQRFAQMQGVLQLANSDPEVKYNKHELHRAMLTLMKVNNIDRFLPPPPLPPQPQDPAQELVSFMTGKPVVVVPNQDHASHIMVHMNYLRDPLCGRNPVMIPITAKILDHLREHIGYHFAMRLVYAAQNNAQLGQEIQMQGGIPATVPPERVMAQASAQIVAQDLELAQEALAVIEEAAEFIRINGPQDPNIAAVKAQSDVQKLEIQRKADKDMMDTNLKLSQQEMQHRMSEIQNMFKERELEHKEQIDKLQLGLDGKVEHVKQLVEILKNEQDNKQKQFTDLLKNDDDNRTRVLIETIKQGFTSMGQTDVDRDNSAQTKKLEELIQKATEAKSDERLSLIMEGLSETIRAARAPRRTTAIRDEEGNMVGARSELDEDKDEEKEDDDE
jgi:hypothetical protein